MNGRGGLPPSSCTQVASRLILIIVLEAMLSIQSLLPDLILSNRILVTRPVKVDHIACGRALESRIVRAQSALLDRRELLMAVAACSKRNFLDDAIGSH